MKEINRDKGMDRQSPRHFMRDVFTLLWRNFNDNLVNTLRPRPNGRHFPKAFSSEILNENVSISIKIWLKVVPNSPINEPSLVQIKGWHRAGDKPSCEPMMAFRDRLTFNTGIPIPGKDGLYIETGPWWGMITAEKHKWEHKIAP